jgi:hypothetical protein
VLLKKLSERSLFAKTLERVVESLSNTVFLSSSFLLNAILSWKVPMAVALIQGISKKKIRPIPHFDVLLSAACKAARYGVVIALAICAADLNRPIDAGERRERAFGREEEQKTREKKGHWKQSQREEKEKESQLFISLGNTALHLVAASRFGYSAARKELCLYLISKGARVDVANLEGKKPQDLAGNKMKGRQKSAEKREQMRSEREKKSG